MELMRWSSAWMRLSTRLLDSYDDDDDDDDDDELKMRRAHLLVVEYEDGVDPLVQRLDEAVHALVAPRTVEVHVDVKHLVVVIHLSFRSGFHDLDLKKQYLVGALARPGLDPRDVHVVLPEPPQNLKPPSMIEVRHMKVTGN
jgi:hypothetical protein